MSNDVQPKRKAGRPPKCNPNKPADIAKRIDQQKMKFGAKVADNLDKLFDVMYTTALLDPKASPTNKISCTKFCLEYAATFLEEEATVVPEDYKPEDEEEEIGELISLTAIG